MSTASQEAQTWHYGLIARWWAEFNTDGEDIAWYEQLVRERGEPALDLGCGTGRLLLPMLAAGLDVDGCDLSGDMLSHCRAAAGEASQRTRLFEQAMHTLDIPRSYRTIFIVGSFGIGGTRADDLEALRRVRAHLEPGGTLAFNLFLPNFDGGSWRSWLPDRRPKLPTPWPEEGDTRVAADGSRLELTQRVLTFDPLEQSVTREIRVRQYGAEDSDEIVAEDQYTLRINIYFKNEVMLMLDIAGFCDVEVRGGPSEHAAAPYEDGELVFIATR